MPVILTSTDASFVDIAMNVASVDNVSAFGYLVDEVGEADVDVRPWPKQGYRAILSGAGGDPLHTRRDLRVIRDGEVILARVSRFGNGGSVQIGRAAKLEEGQTSSPILVDKARRQTDSGAIFCSKSGDPFILLLANDIADVKPVDFQAFYFQGTKGFHVNPGVWYQYPFPVVSNTIELSVKESIVYSSQLVDFSTIPGKSMRFTTDQDVIDSLLNTDVIPISMTSSSDRERSEDSTSDSDMEPQSYNISEMKIKPEQSEQTITKEAIEAEETDEKGEHVSAVSHTSSVLISDEEQNIARISFVDSESSVIGSGKSLSSQGSPATSRQLSTTSEGNNTLNIGVDYSMCAESNEIIIAL